MDWKFDLKDPPIPGWYAVLYCWDIEEGVFSGAYFWDGTAWSWDGPITVFSSGTFKTGEEAEDWARENDLER